MEILNVVLQLPLVPVLAWLGLRLVSLESKVAVLESQVANDRDAKENILDTLERIQEKL